MKSFFKSSFYHVGKVGIISLSLLSLLILRGFGGFQWLEWLALDILFQLRPTELSDERIVLVGLTEADIQQLKTSQLSDLQLSEVIRRIQLGKPAAIGLDFFRDQPVGEGREDLITAFSSFPHLYGIGKQSGIEGHPIFSPVDPPPIAVEQIADVAIQEDGDSILRRLFLYPTTKPAIPSLGLALACEYLSSQGIEPEAGQDGWLKLGQVTFFPFNNPSGPYIQAGDKGYQIFINWRKSNFSFVSVGDLLAGDVSSQQFQEKIILIGSYAPSLKDQFLTPFSRSWTGTSTLMHGMEVQAQLASVIIDNALGERPLIFFWNEPGISLWIVAWGVITAIFVTFNNRQWGKILLFLIIISVALTGIGYFAFLQAIWIPIVPATIVIWFVGVVLSIWDYEWGQREDRLTIQELNQKLKKKLDRRQIYRDAAVLAHQCSNSLIPSLQTLLNTQSLLQRQETDLVEKINLDIIEPKLRSELFTLLAQFSIAYEEQGRQIELLSLKLASYFPNLDSLLTFQQSETIEGVHLEIAISSAISSIRPLFFEEYHVDLNQHVSVKYDSNQEMIFQPQKLAVLFNRIFDEIFSLCQLEGISFSFN